MFFTVILFTIVASISSLNAVPIYQCPPNLTPDGDWSNVTFFTNFKLAQSPNQVAKQSTKVHFCYSSDELLLKYECQDDNITSPYTDCNQPLYNSDVVEVFLTKVYSGSSVDLYHYLELEVSPNGILFVSHISNSDLNCNGIQGQLVDCNVSGVVWEAHKDDELDNWWAYLSIPWNLIGGIPHVGSSFSGNFFRIDTPLGNPTEYSCWQSTDSNPACFHKPKFFGTFDFS